MESESTLSVCALLPSHFFFFGAGLGAGVVFFPAAAAFCLDAGADLGSRRLRAAGASSVSEDEEASAAGAGATSSLSADESSSSDVD